MIVSHCPRCEEEFRVPASPLPEDAYAQCPWCGESFPLSDVVRQLPPMLEILSADGQPITAAPAAFAAGGQLPPGGSEPSYGEPEIDWNAQDGPESDPATVEAVVEDDLGDQIQIDTGLDTGLDEEPHQVQDSQEALAAITGADSVWEGDQVAAPMPTMKVSPRRGKQSKGSGIKTAIMVVLGGLGALPLAGFILWAVGRPPDLGFWPFDGSQVAARRTVAAEPAELSNRPSLTAQSPQGRDLTSGLGDAEPNSMLDDPADSALAEIMGSSDSATEVVGSDPSEDNILRALTTPVDTSSETTASSGAAMPSTPVGASQPGMVSEPDESPAVEPETETVPQPEASAQSVVAAEQAVDTLLGFQGPETERRVQLIKTYAQIAAACDQAVQGDSGLQSLAEKLKESSILKEIEYAGAQWFDYGRRSSDGIALLGRVGQGDQGPTLTLDSGKVIPLTGSLPSGAAGKVLLLGRIVDQGSAIESVVVEPLP